MDKNYIAPWVRVIILISSIIIISTISYSFTGSIIPNDSRNSLIFQNALLLIVIGTALLEKYYTKPADSMVNALMGIITLISVYNVTPSLIWWLVFSFASFVFILSTISTSIYSFEAKNERLIKLADITYEPAVLFGQARIFYSILFLFAVFTFKGIQSNQTVELVIFWAIFVVIWPLRVPQLITNIFSSQMKHKPLGFVTRTDWPNIIRIAVQPNMEWKSTSIKIFQQANGKQNLVLPLYYEPQGEQMVGTGLVVKENEKKLPNLKNGFIYDPDKDFIISDSEISQALGGGAQSKLIGFIVEESTTSEIKFEIWNPHECREGMLIWCDIEGNRVYYQIASGSTKEETFQTNRHGFQLGIAAQLGILDKGAGFIKYLWIPKMNSPVFYEGNEFGESESIIQPGDFVYGNIPGTNLRIGGAFTINMDHHTAILGITGSGKTELAFDLIRHSINQGIKVICIDLTARYEFRLNDLHLNNLTLSPEIIRELNLRLFDVETGKFGAPDEKKALQDFSQEIRQNVQNVLKGFLEKSDENNQIGMITLEEISNTKATLYITEMYLTCLLHLKRENTNSTPKILIVVEEAHTVMPEPSTMGLGDFDLKGLVGKISQIALQGRKYGVGLLVIAQRTATVSKSILTQCNTVISFNCFDDTSLGFLSNIFGSSFVPLIPNLPPLNAIVFGKGVRSQRPVIIQIPFDEEKAKALT